ncbi:MAG: hypothetical protein K2X08_03130, partial [Chlamydiales bacterium]|nr:hypothetical protein [Chlamydiales bacterium]
MSMRSCPSSFRSAPDSPAAGFSLPSPALPLPTEAPSALSRGGESVPVSHIQQQEGAFHPLKDLAFTVYYVALGVIALSMLAFAVTGVGIPVICLGAALVAHFMLCHGGPSVNTPPGQVFASLFGGNDRAADNQGSINQLDVDDPSQLDVDDPPQLDVDDPAQLDVDDPAQLDVDDPAQLDVDDPAQLDVDDPAQFSNPGAEKLEPLEDGMEEIVLDGDKPGIQQDKDPKEEGERSWFSNLWPGFAKKTGIESNEEPSTTGDEENARSFRDWLPSFPSFFSEPRVTDFSDDDIEKKIGSFKPDVNSSLGSSKDPGMIFRKHIISSGSCINFSKYIRPFFSSPEAQPLLGEVDKNEGVFEEGEDSSRQGFHTLATRVQGRIEDSPDREENNGGFTEITERELK